MKLSVYTCIIAVFAFIIVAQATYEFQDAFENVPFFGIPVDMDAIDDEDIYVTSLTGTVVKFANNDATTTATTFLDLANSPLAFYDNGFVGGDEGLLSMEFHPKYPDTNKIYIAYTPTPTTFAVVALKVNSGVVSYTNPDVLFNITRPEHKDVGYITEAYLGGDLRFGAKDDDHNNLYISVGYCNDDDVTVNPNSYLGKILRVTPSRSGVGYSVPTSNPKVGNVRTPIFASGSRNPRKMYFSREPTRLFVGDVGDVYDEINVINSGDDYGWNIVESCTTNPDYTNPIYSFTSSEAPHSITMGPYYDDSHFSGLRESVLFAELYSGNLYNIVNDYDDDDEGGFPSDCNATPNFIATGPPFISSILEIDGEIIVCSAFGPFYEYVPTFARLVNV